MADNDQPATKADLESMGVELRAEIGRLIEASEARTKAEIKASEVRTNTRFLEFEARMEALLREQESRLLERSTATFKRTRNVTPSTSGLRPE